MATERLTAETLGRRCHMSIRVSRRLLELYVSVPHPTSGRNWRANESLRIQDFSVRLLIV